MRQSWTIAGSIAVAFLLLVKSGRAEEGVLSLTQEQVSACLEANLPRWQAGTEKGRPYLFFTPAEWAALPKEAEGWQGERLRDKNQLLRRAEVLARAPLPVYRSPEELAKDGSSLFEAQQELWLRPLGDELVLLSLAQRLQPNEAVGRRLHDLVLRLCEFPTWGKRGPNRDLACAHVGRGIAIARDWHPQLWSSEEHEVIRTTIRNRVGQLYRGLIDDQWIRHFEVNHNHVDVGALGLCGLAFLNEIPEADQWLAAAILNFQTVADRCSADGVSPEGVPYWSYGMSFILQFIEGTRNIAGTDQLYRSEYLRNAIGYRLNVATPGLNGLLPWGDAGSKDSYGPHHILQRLSAEFSDEDGAYLAHNLPFGPSGGDDVLAWNLIWQGAEANARTPQQLDHLFAEANMATTRSGWSKGDYLLAVKGGINNKNHGHLDSGSIAFSFGDEWLIKAPGYGSGRSTREFWQIDGPRWEFFSNATESHSTLLINGENQRFDIGAGSRIDGYFSAPQMSWTSIEMSGAYRDEASVRREILHRRNDYILMIDRVTLGREAVVEDLIQTPAYATLDSGRIVVDGGAGSVTVESLNADGGFHERQPTSKVVDVSPEILRSFAAEKSGSTIRFVTLITPRFATDFGPAVTTALDESASMATIRRGDQWQDTVWYGEQNQDRQVDLDLSLFARSRLLFVRKAGDVATEIFAANAVSLKYADFDVALDVPGSVAIRRLGPEAWWMEIKSDGEGTLHWPTAMKLAGRDGKLIVVENGGRRRWDGEYLLARDEKAVLRAIALLDKAPPERNAPEIPVKQQARPMPAAAGTSIIVPASSFTDQRSGRAKLATKPGTVQPRVVQGFGNESSFHVMTWPFEISQAGRYKIKLRYCTGAESMKLALLVDGYAPSAQARDISLGSTGGWSVSQGDWKDVILAGADGQPVYLDLESGRHQISLAGPTAAMNLDQIEMVGAADE